MENLEKLDFLLRITVKVLISLKNVIDEKRFRIGLYIKNPFAKTSKSNIGCIGIPEKRTDPNVGSASAWMPLPQYLRNGATSDWKKNIRRGNG